MAIRELIQKYQTVALVISALVVIVGIGTAYRTLKSPNVDAEHGQWFTTDDGSTHFADASNPIPPFDHNGKPAVLAHVAHADTGSALKIIYLERFTPDAHTIAEKLRAKQPVSPEELQRLAKGREFKAPGETAWHSFSSDMDLTYWAHDLAEKQGCGKGGFVDPN